MTLYSRLSGVRKHVPLFLSIGLQLILALFLGHAYDIRVFMSTGYLVGTGQNPYLVQELSRVFPTISFQGITSVGDFPLWPLMLGLVYLVIYKTFQNLLLYDLVLKIPIIVANISLAYLVANILRKLGADEKVARKARVFLLFNPFLLYATSAWGQFDSMVALLSLLALLLLSEGRLTYSAVLLALAISFKPTPLPLVPVIFVYLQGRPLERVLKYFAIFSICVLLFVVSPFAIMRWDPTIILQHWNYHFSVVDGLSFITILELMRNSYELPGLWWLVGMVWVPALGISIFALKPGDKGFLELLKKSTALIMVFFLFQVRVTEPNIVLILPFVLILTSMGALDRRALTAVWVLPLVFGFFNTSMFQLLFPSMPTLMDRLLQLSDVFRAARLVTRTIVVIPWLIAGGWIVSQCLRYTHVSRI